MAGATKTGSQAATGTPASMAGATKTGSQAATGTSASMAGANTTGPQAAAEMLTSVPPDVDVEINIPDAASRKQGFISFLVQKTKSAGRTIKAFAARQFSQALPDDVMDLEEPAPTVFKAMRLSEYEDQLSHVEKRIANMHLKDDATARKSLMIVDSGAQISCVNNISIIDPESFTTIDEKNPITIQGIVEAVNLRIDGAGSLKYPLDEIRVVYAPDASDNILSFFDAKKSFWIELVAQDLPDEHLRLTHKTRPNLVLRCPIDPDLGMYVVEASRTAISSHLEFAPKRNRLYHLSMVRKMQDKGMPKRIAVNASRIQDLHEALSFVGKSAMKQLIEQRRLGGHNADLTLADHRNWADPDGYHDHACTGCSAGKTHDPEKPSSSSKPTERIGTLQTDIYYVTCPIAEGNLTVMCSVDEACGYISNKIVESKAQVPLIAAFIEIKAEYRALNHDLTAVKTDNEPAFADLKDSLRDKLQISLTHCEPFRHMTMVERAIRYSNELFLATLHGAGIPIPAFLYADLIKFVTHAANLTFSTKNDMRTPAELMRGDVVVLDIYTKAKFGQLVTFYDGTPNRSSDKPRNLYGLVIGYDTSRPHCTIIFDFVNGGRKSVANYSLAEWTPGLKSLYIEKFAETHFSESLPVFLYHELEIEAASSAHTVATTTTAANNNAMTASDSDESDSDDKLPISSRTPTTYTRSSDAGGWPEAYNIVPPASRPKKKLFCRSTEPSKAIKDLLHNPLAMGSAAHAPPSAHTGGYAFSRVRTPAMKPKYNEDAWNELLGTYTPDQDPNLVDAVAELLSHGTEQLGSGIIIDSDLDDQDAGREGHAEQPPQPQPVDMEVEHAPGAKSHDHAERPPPLQSVGDRIKINPRLRVPKIYNMSITKALKTYPSSKVHASVLKEIKQMIDYQVWDFLTTLELDEAYARGTVKNIIPSSFFLKMKSDLETLKARLIVHGDKQILLDLFGSNSSPTISITVLNLVISLASKMGLDFESLDIAGAYLNAPLPEPEFMRINKDLADIIVEINPDYQRFQSPKGHMTVRLKKALYGLKTSG